ncbi:hypothetical protein [Limobrevibacterium gyesilva]|uniref:Uncharacterized protein n=1 Tax=Limobrevibacterium gyesilva TaxID=2991712 RepID=A0AA41YPM7_9PROT|nr:hypothetical protein [Limobrevibacterium gyesilva]MCW3477384.1 hypothetical protein [Limobrevibacterium gyesilva]
MANHPNRSSRTAGSAFIPQRLIELSDLLRRADLGNFDAAHPREHEAAWRRAFLPLFDATAAQGIPGHCRPLGAEALGVVLDVCQITADAVPEWASLSGTQLEITLPGESDGDALVIVLAREDGGWNAAEAWTQPSEARHLSAIVQIAAGARYRVARRTEWKRGEPQHELLALPLAAQF